MCESVSGSSIEELLASSPSVLSIPLESEHCKHLSRVKSMPLTGTPKTENHAGLSALRKEVKSFGLVY